MTRRAGITVIVAAMFAAIVFQSAPAKKVERDRPYRTGPTAPADRESYYPPAPNVTAPPETTVLGYWTFDNGGCDPQGWTPYDFTAQSGDYVHVDDFAGLGGGDFGKLYPLEGSQSIWCGARPDPNDYELCGYAKLPGYGNSWDQGFCTADCLPVQGDVIFDYLIAYYSEPGYDFVDIEYDTCDGNWVSVRNFSGEQPPIQLSDTASVSVHDGSLRWRVSFRSDGAWSDEDGLWDTDGAYILDSLTVRDDTGVILATELMETESVGDQTTVSGNWTSCPAPSFGDYSGLVSGAQVLQEDPCHTNLTCLWGFFSGSTADYSCGGYPDQKAVPYGNADGQYINNYVVSPVIPITGSGSTIEFDFDIYLDLPLNAVVFYMWAVRGIDAAGCPGPWRDRASVGGYGDLDQWRRLRQPVDDLIRPAGATEMQVMLGVLDMCEFWGGTFGTCECHTHAPLFDNVEVLRIEHKGPAWSVRDIDLFQDNFADDGTTTGTVRMDMARDILPWSNPGIRPGDSLVVQTYYPEGDLAADPHTGFGSAVYAWFNVCPPQPAKSGPALVTDSFRWPLVDSLTSGGDMWYCLRMDTAFTGPDREGGNLADGFCLDINDSLFTPGDTVRFFFSATSGPPASATHYYSEFTGATDDLGAVLAAPMEATCLPTPGADILYVDDHNPPEDLVSWSTGWGTDGGAAELYFQTAFQILGIENRVDRFDVRGPTSRVGNGPASRVKNVSQQLIPVYRTIIWNTGDLTEGLIGDGTDNIDKSHDFAMLYDYIRFLTTPGGLYLSGDNLAYEWDAVATGAAPALRSNYIDFVLTGGDHLNLGLPVSPRVAGETGFLSGDEFLAFGGCPPTAFDVFSAAGTPAIEAGYSNAGSGYGAVVAQSTTNSAAQDVGVVLSGFSYHQIRDLDENGIPARVDHLKKILEWLGNSVPSPTGADSPGLTNALEQNYPNPFNPATAIAFTVRERTPVTLRVYNVAGQLVKTLVDDTRSPGVVHTVEWDGRNHAGQSVASGVYFYRMVTTGYTKTRKMVLLK